jgi:hypothetical protein
MRATAPSSPLAALCGAECALPGKVAGTDKLFINDADKMSLY